MLKTGKQREWWRLPRLPEGKHLVPAPGVLTLTMWWLILKSVTFWTKKKGNHLINQNFTAHWDSSSQTGRRHERRCSCTNGSHANAHAQSQPTHTDTQKRKPKSTRARTGPPGLCAPSAAGASSLHPPEGRMRRHGEEHRATVTLLVRLVENTEENVDVWTASSSRANNGRRLWWFGFLLVWEKHHRRQSSNCLASSSADVLSKIRIYLV